MATPRLAPPLVLAGLLAVLTGCAAAPPPAEEARPVWPPPPLVARIEFVRSLASDEDLGRATPFAQRLLGFLGGAKPAPPRIVEPMGLAVSDDGRRLYVADLAQLAVFVLDFEGKTFARLGGEEPLAGPLGLALDAEERLHVVEQARRGISVFDRSGARVRFITHPSLERPAGIAIDRARGRIYVADAGHTRSAEHTVKVFDTEGALVGAIGRGKGEEPGQFLFPTYVAVDGAGRVYVTDTLNARVQVFDAEGRHLRVVGQRGNRWGMFDTPKGVALDGFGNLYVADSGWSHVQIFNERGQVLLFFGGRGPLPGMLKNPTALAIDGANRIYVADYLNHRVLVYRLVNTRREDSLPDPVAATRTP